uniref:Molybdenum cofactor sulfurase-like protein n=1 Tax=Apopellia endiviifolia (species B) TaxID=119729 RepID=A0A6B7NQP9_9MARC|nr:molybdenum cofactor sulfurase-like protein [Apopellia endiviifolia (species B)]
MGSNPVPPRPRRQRSKEEEPKARTFVIPPHIIAEAMSSLHGLDLRWSGPITSTEMRYVEQYVQARYPEYYEGLIGNKASASDLPSLKEDQEYSEDGSGRSTCTPTGRRSPKTNQDLAACFGSALPEPKKMPLEPSRLLDILTKKSTSHDSSISIPEMHARNRVVKACELQENDYIVVFTTNLKEAMMLVGGSYPFFRYNYYMTVLEEQVDCIREFAIYKEAKVLPAPVSWLDLRIAGSQLSQYFRKKSKHSPKGLFAYPADVRGTRNSLHWVSEAQRNCWHVLLDATELILGEDQLNLTLHKPDYALCTLPKSVGQKPTITCLLVRRSSFGILTPR